MRLRAVSWNVHSWVGTDRREDPGRIAEVLARLQADVVGLQEVDWRTSRPDDRDPFELVARRVGMTAIPGPNLADHRGEYGNGLLTRLPVEAVDRFVTQDGVDDSGTRTMDAFSPSLGGRLEIQSQPDQGTYLVAHLPAEGYP